ncbi:MAG: DUF996 domain-containing protein [candidate division NC10 bacterium]
MATLGEAKILGGVGAILLLFPFVNLVGWILVLIAVKYISDITRDRSVFDNMLYAVILAIIGTVAVTLIIVLPFLGLGGITGPIDLTNPAAIFLGVFTLIGLVVGWIFALISALFLRRSFDSIATHLNVPTFATAGLIYLIGAALMIVIVGFLLVGLIAPILMIVAFFSIKEQQPAAGVAQPPFA